MSRQLTTVNSQIKQWNNNKLPQTHFLASSAHYPSPSWSLRPKQPSMGCPGLWRKGRLSSFLPRSCIWRWWEGIHSLFVEGSQFCFVEGEHQNYCHPSTGVTLFPHRITVGGGWAFQCQECGLEVLLSPLWYSPPVCHFTIPYKKEWHLYTLT